MPDPKTTANTADGAAAQSSPESSKANTLQTKYDADAPPRCEMCDADVPDMATRRAHMAETKHCHCFECNAYVPPGGLYSHWCDAHGDLTWNDHAVAWTDNENVKNAMPWVREELEKRRKRIESL